MKIIRPALVAAVLVALLIAPAFGNGVAYEGAARQTYTLKATDTPVCKVRKPYLEYVEDGLAAIFDVPFALLSPICCPVVTPVIDWLDREEDRKYTVVCPPTK